MANRLRISVVAPPRVQEAPKPDQAAVDRMMAHWDAALKPVLCDEPDLILVPEVCDRYGGHDTAQAEAYYRVRGEQVQQHFSRVAAAAGCYVAYAAFRERPAGTWRNSIVLLDRAGAPMGAYDKNHPTVPELEDGEAPGREAPIFTCDFGRVACAICFDLNFEELLRTYAAEAPDLILFASLFHGGPLQAHWAYTCRAHFAAAVAGLPSAIRNPTGQPVATTTNYRHFVTAAVNLDCKLAHLDFNGEKLAALKRAYGREVTIYDPGLLGSVLVSSENERRTAAELFEEFAIEPLDAYLARSRAYQQAAAR